MKRLALTVLLALWSFAAYAEEVIVTVSIPPQKYVVDRISGGTVKVNVLVPAGADPHTFSPKAQDALMLAKSSLYLGVGFVFEKSTLPRIASSYKRLQIIDTSRGLQTIAEHGHEHEEEGEHNEAQLMDPHVWVSPANMREIAKNTADALIAANPAEKSRYEAGLADFLKDIDRIDARFKALFAEKGRVSFIVYHPTFGYFAKDYGLTQLALEIDGKSPKAADLAALLDRVEDENIRIFIVQPVDTTGRKVAADLGISPQEADMLAADWMGLMERLYAIFSRESSL
jgi:zinc transport system substrate-binding protein